VLRLESAGPTVTSMRLFRLAIVGVLIGCAAIVGRAQTPAIATFRGVGPHPPNPAANSAVRDATKVGSVIYAVGGSGNEAMLWTWDGTSGVVRTVLPNAPSYTSGAAGVTAGAINRDATYIASQARSSTGLTAVQVRASDGFTTDLNAAPFPSFPANRSATSISSSGLILSGVVGANPGAARFDLTDHTTTVIPLLPGTTGGNRTAQLGMSSNGGVIVGTSFNTPYVATTNGHAFRYVHGTPGTVSAIPELSGGTWSKAIAISPDGNLTLAGGNSTFLPNGEAYLYDAGANATTPLGSPNTAWAPAGAGGLTSDGSVVVISFFAAANPCSPAPCTPARYPYLHNSHGWFALSSALADAGVDLGADGWSMEGGSVFGISPDGTLVFGQTLHENDDATTGFRRLEGFVAEFPAGFLADYNPLPVAPANTSIVGAWYFQDPDPDPATSNSVVLFFLANGTYFHIEANNPASVPSGASGFERGLYTWDSVSNAITIKTLQDTNGDIGLSGVNGVSFFKAGVSGDSILFYVDGCSDPECSFGPGQRITGGAGSVVGGWVFGNSAISDSSRVLLLLSNNTYYLAQDGNSVTDPTGRDGIEMGTYAWGPGTGFSSSATRDTNGGWGLGVFNGLQLSRDELVGTFSNGPTPFPFTRIVDATAVVPVITSALSATGGLGVPFSYTITATHGQTFNAGVLPAGLTVDTTSGAISGTPSVAGASDVTISATNTFLSSVNATLHIVIDPPVVGLSTGSLAFGNQTVGIASASQGATLTNTGNGVLTLSVAITGANAADFAQLNTCGGSVAPGANCTINVTMTATATGARAATVTISDDAAGSPHAISLSGTGNVPAVSLSAASVTFGNQNVGTTSASQAVTLTNTGAGVLTLGISITGANAADFGQTSPSCGASVAPGTSCTINVTFTPTNTGTRSAVVTIADNAAGTPHSIALSGTGKTGQIKLTPDPVAFGVQTLGTTSASQQVKVQNTGTTALSLGTITASSEFAVAGQTCGATLAVAATCTVNVTFTPSAGGLRSGVLTVPSGAGTGVVGLTGTGNIASVSPSSLDFGNQTVGVNSAPRTVTLTNLSNSAALGVGAVTVTGTNAADFTLSNGCGSSLPLSSSCGIAITFKPGKKGPRTASLSITDNGGGGPHVVPLSGFGK
jgi:hypothetical protein